MERGMGNPAGAAVGRQEEAAGPRRIETSIAIHSCPESVFLFHEDPRNLTKVLPAYLRIEVADAPPKLRLGARLRCMMFVGPFGFDWRLEITDYAPPHRFVDEQKEGPFRRYAHTHLIEERGRWTRLTDIIEYEMPPGPLAELASRIGFRNRLQDVIEHAQRATRALLERSG